MLSESRREHRRALDALVEEFEETSTCAGANGWAAARSDAHLVQGVSHPGSPTFSNASQLPEGNFGL